MPFSERHKCAVFTIIPCCHLFLPTSAVVFTCLPLLLSIYLSTVPLISSVSVYICCHLYLSTSASVPVFLCFYLYMSTSAVVWSCLPLLSSVPVYLCCRLYLSTSSTYNLFLSNFAVICSCLTLLPFVLFPVHLHHRSNSICFLFSFIIVATASVSCSHP